MGRGGQRTEDTKGVPQTGREWGKKNIGARDNLNKERKTHETKHEV